MSAPTPSPERDRAPAASDPVPLGPAQRLVWVAQTLAGDVPLYNLAITCTIDGPLDADRLARACEALVADSDLLQSRVVDGDTDVPKLVRDPSIGAGCERLELASEEALRDWVHERVRVPLDPRRRVLDCALVALPGGRHVLYWCQHHLSADGASIPLTLEALAERYRALGPDAGDAAPAPPPSYHAFLRSEVLSRDSARHERNAAYWHDKGEREADVPAFFGRTFDGSHAKVRRPLELSEARREAIERALDRPGLRSPTRELSLFVLMATVMAVTGLRLHHGRTLNLGFPARARGSAGTRRLLGMVTGVGYLALELDPADTFRDVARRVMREAVVSISRIEPGVQTRETQRAWSSGINVLVAPVDDFAGLPASVEWHYPGCSDSNSQLDLNLVDFGRDGRFELSFDMAVSVFAEHDRRTYAASFARTLDALLADPGLGIADFDLVSPDERAAVLRLGAGPAAAPPPAATLHGLFARQVARTPDAVALKEGVERLTWTELDARSDAVAAWLPGRGVGPGDAVGICFRRSIGVYAAMLGAMKAGAVFVPLDPTYPAERLGYMVADSGARLVLGDARTRADVEIDGTEIVDVDAVARGVATDAGRRPADGDAPDGPARDGAADGEARTTGDALYVMYTSGSTGLPKGVVGTHSATLNRFAWMWRRYPFQSDEVCCQKTALSFVDSIWELFGPLLQGVPTVVVPDETVRDVFAFVDLLEAERVTRLVLVPSFLAVLLDSDPQIGERLRSLEVCIVSGEPLPLHVARAFLDRMGHCRLLNLYGSTEVTADVTADEVGHDRLAVRMPIGRPIDGVDVYVLDDRSRVVPRGAVGEICIAGAGLSGGYFDRPELDAEKFVPDPFDAGGADGVPRRMFRTGDLGRFDARGLLEHHGRRDTQLKVRGHRIEAAEIEHAALEFDGVRSAVLFVGEGERLWLFYTVAAGDEADEAALVRRLESRLPDHMIPEPVRITRIPLLGNGKVNRKGLASLVPDAGSGTADATAPRTPTEEALAEIWKRTLGLVEIDVHADFFDLGGNSIAAMRIMVGARKAGIALALREILEIGTVAGIAVAIDANPVRHRVRRAGGGADGPDGRTKDEEDLLRIDELIEASDTIGGHDDVVDIFQLTTAQKGILFHLLLQGTDAPLYLAQVRVDLVGRMDEALFQRAWDTVARRHGMLRSVILHEGLHEPVQVVVERGGIALDWHDAGTDDPALRAARCTALAEERLATPIPLGSHPMLRVTLVRLDPDLTHMIFDWHHILMDGWSLAVLSNEVLLTYAALLKDEPLALDEVGSFRDHVVALAEQDRDAIRGFWRERLAGLHAPTLLSNQADKAAELYARANLNVVLDPDSTARLFEFTRRCRVTINTVVQAAWALLLSKYNDTDDVAYGFAVTGRSSGIEHYETTIGMFVNSLPMRIRCDGTKTLIDWLRAIQNEQMEIVQYENASLVDIQHASEMPPNAPMFDSLLVFQNVPRLTVATDFPLEVWNRTVHENSPTPMTVEVFPGHALEIQVMYIEEMFVERTVAQVIDHFVDLIKAIAAREPDARVGEIEMMDEGAVLEMVARFNDTARDWRLDGDVTAPIWERARAAPDAPAASFGEVRLSYGELAGRADELAGELVGRGVGPGDLVGVCLPREANLLVALLATLRAGAAYLPLDPDYPQARIDAILDDAGVALLVTASDVATTAGFDGAPTLLLDADRLWSASGPDDALAPVAATADDLAYVIYTSGSTGRPKGVRVTRANLRNFLHAMRERPGLDADDRLLAVTTVAFDIAALELLLPLTCGARVDVAARDATFDGLALANRIEAEGITAMQATPTTWRLLLAAGWEGTPGLKALVGGEALPRDLVAALLPRVGSLWNMYGPTETTVWSTCDRVTDPEAAPTIGRPIANTEVLVLDANGRPCPVSVPGELCIAGAGVSAGYVGRDDLTAEKFVPHPLRPDSGERIYRTGDLARWLDDGRLDCLGRMDDQVKLRGFRIELGEIEAVLADVPGVDHAVASLVRNADTEYLAAYLVADASVADGVPNELVLREALRERLPLYMVPAAFMVLDAVPRTPNGKVDRRALPNPGSTAANLAELATVDVHDLPENRPATGMERTLSALWEKSLYRGEISVNSNFFDLGGNSIGAMQIMSACRKRGLELSILDIFDLGTIRLCAAAVEERAATAAARADGANGAAAADGKRDASSGTADAPSHATEDLARIAKLLRGETP